MLQLVAVSKVEKKKKKPSDFSISSEKETHNKSTNASTSWLVLIQKV